MITYKLFRLKNGNLYPLYVDADTPMPIGVWLDAKVGEKIDDTHVKAKGCGGKLSLRPGFHSTKIPFTDWIGKKDSNGNLVQRANTVWCECEVEGKELVVPDRYGSRHLLNGWYYYKTNSKQKEPWIISNKIKINKILTNGEVDMICLENGISPQKREV